MVGAAGTATGWTIGKTLHEFWPDARFVTADINPPWLYPAATLAAATVQMPLVRESNYLDVLRKELIDHGVDIYMPLLDEELVLTAADLDWFREHDMNPYVMNAPGMKWYEIR